MQQWSNCQTIKGVLHLSRLLKIQAAHILCSMLSRGSNAWLHTQSPCHDHCFPTRKQTT